MSDNLRPELEHIFDLHYPNLATLIGSHAGRQLVRAMIQHAFHEGVTWTLARAEHRYIVVDQNHWAARMAAGEIADPCRMPTGDEAAKVVLGFTDHMPACEEMATAGRKPADHACGYGLCPPWCANRNPNVEADPWTS